MKTPVRPLFFAPATILAGILLGIPLIAQSTIPTPVFEFRFNDSGADTASTGSNTTNAHLVAWGGSVANLHSADQKGVSGKSGDYAFDNSASDKMGGSSGSPGQGGAARILQADGMGAVTLQSFTVQGWYYGNSQPTGAARLLEFSGLQVMFSNNGLTMAFNGNTLTVQAGDGYDYRPTENWVFFAISVDASVSTNNVKFYAGTVADEVAPVATFSLTPAQIGTISSETLRIGNTSALDRPFDGLIDNMRIWNTALDEATLRSVRTADLSFSTIPEPSSIGLFGGLAILSAMLFLRRR
ncbi:PEP-CTERM putative exosortase interaction domain-containing protein [Opitutaceae bacterium TAV1]|nr:PEP-CTERM putative exosortase interaction domain-containing protein [Opitutaceae bacterium TAV1]